MKPKSIGIVGGAGPLAGVYFLERLIVLSGKLYGCYRDEDFPQIFLISYPFSEMLRSERDVNKLQSQLGGCLGQLRSNGASILTIACNTLHAFLDEDEELSDLIHLPRTVGEEVSHLDPPLVLCTSTSVQFGLHRKFFPCSYPDALTQREVDLLIDQTLKGIDRLIVLERLERLLRTQTAATIILGCTELSLYSASLTVPNKRILDPLELMANKVLQTSFSNIRS